MALSGVQKEKLNEALRSAYNQQRLTMMLGHRLNKNLADYAGLSDPYPWTVFQLIQGAEAEGWTQQLIRGALESNPGNSAMQEFAQHMGLSPATPALERTIRENVPTLDVALWRTGLDRVEKQVCRIEIAANAGTIFGTGFLVAPDVVITNHHVMEAVIQGARGQATTQGIKALPSDVILRFDYKKLADGQPLNAGTVYFLAEDWLIDASPSSPLDIDATPGEDVPQLDQLDYALLRLNRAIGTLPVGDRPEPTAPPRGWIAVPTTPYRFEPQSPLLIMQHPQGAPLKLAMDTNAVIAVNRNQTRVRYKTNTEEGSSGAPCFDINWQLVALHHVGDPNFDPTHQPTFNQGIPFTAIRSLLHQRGLENVFAAPIAPLS